LVQAEAQTCFNSLKQLVEEALAPEIVQVATATEDAVTRTVEIGADGEKTSPPLAAVSPGQSSPEQTYQPLPGAKSEAVGVVSINITVSADNELLVEASKLGTADKIELIELKKAEQQSLLALYVALGTEGNDIVNKYEWMKLCFNFKSKKPVPKLFQNRASQLRDTLGLLWERTDKGEVKISGLKFECPWDRAAVKNYLRKRLTELKCLSKI
jgi:hypothetical protein